MNERLLQHLNQEYTEPVRDPVWKNISLSPALLKLVDHPAYQKLNQIKQLGPTYLVYPGATHTRLNHSFGVFHIAWRMLRHLLRHYHLSEMSIPGVKAFLSAALLHDLGHYPYAHSLKDLKVASHESLTAKMILEKDFSDIIVKEVGADPTLVAAIIDTDLVYEGDENIGFFRQLLSGVLDPDKLDYLNRDAYYCGVPYGVQDVDFVLDELVPHDNRLAISWKGLAAVESILFSKYLMYRTVYWHKTVRIATAMIKKAVLMCLAKNILQPQDLYGLDDREFTDLAEMQGFSAFPPMELIRRVSSRQFYKLVFAEPFSDACELHRDLENLEHRLRYEQRLAEELTRLSGQLVGPEDVIIDIPERISFEIDLPVVVSKSSGAAHIVPFSQARSVFEKKTVQGFVQVLRSISILAGRDSVMEAIRKIGCQRLLREGL